VVASLVESRGAGSRESERESGRKAEREKEREGGREGKRARGREISRETGEGVVPDVVWGGVAGQVDEAEEAPADDEENSVP